LIVQREPSWKTLERLEAHAGTLSSAEDVRKQIRAIRLERRLLDSTDPLPSLRSELTEQLRKALNTVQSAHQAAYTAGLSQLAANSTWQQLTAEQQQTILQDVGLTAPAKPDTGTDLSILAALDQRNLATRAAEADAVSGRVSNALKEAAILLEPKVRQVAVEKALLKTAEDVRHWTERQQMALLKAVEKGPIQVQ
jgi:hypothetical protein